MASPEETAIDSFLSAVSAVRATGFSQHWQTFMAYSMVLQARALQSAGFQLNPITQSGQFRFKLWPAGRPSRYSYFEVDRGEERYDLMMNIFCKLGIYYSNLRLSLDLVLLARGSGISNSPVDSSQGAGQLHSFSECKNSDGYPELIATLEGMTTNLQRERLWTSQGRVKASVKDYRFASCLMLAGRATSLSHIDLKYKRRGRQLRIFGELRPGGSGENVFLSEWAT